MMEEENEDRISSLPNPIIHHILSSLPSTKQAIQTGILSKRWHKQWTHVPVLIFDISDFPNNGATSSDMSTFIQHTLNLHQCSIINNFCLQMRAFKGGYMLPEFLFNNASLLKMSMVGCTFMPSGKVNRERLTTLFMNSCRIPDQAVIQHILSGCPLLKSLELEDVRFDFEKLVFSSKSLKRFVLILANFKSHSFHSFVHIEFSCPRLVELSLHYMLLNGAFSSRLDQSIQNVISNCLLLESLELIDYRGFCNLVIASKSLKRLVLDDLVNCLSIDISCPKLEELKLTGCLNVGTVKLHDSPTTLLSAIIDFYHDYEEIIFYSCFDENPEIQQRLLKDILQQLKHVRQLKLGRWFIKVLSGIEVGGLFSMELNIKCLILDYPVSHDYSSGFACVLRSSPMLEKLVINQPLSMYYDDDDQKLNGFLEDCWSSNSLDFDGLASHLKIVTISWFFKRGDKYKLVIDFVQFLLKNVTALEKVVIELKGCGTSSPLEVSQELLSLASEEAIVELLISK